jgi:4-diphosphocytidyl-2-C-methyl-D-erythritol kinase
LHFALLTLPAFAKINLSLRVLGRRTDGLHEICTTFQTVSLCDYLTFELADEISLSTDSKSVPTDEKNLIIVAANQLRKQFSVSRGVKIHLQKQIPSPGGLGGGSADAAVTLLALAHLWKIKTTRQSLVEIAKTIGADVTFFLSGGTAFATGVGNEIESLPDLPPKLLLIVTPNEHVSTAEAYKSLSAPRLTAVDSLGILAICRLARIDFDSNPANLQNDFEKTIFLCKPEIERVKYKLLESGANHALMSGSGASVFGIFDNEKMRQAALVSLRETENDWRIFSCETVSQSEYKRALSPCWDFADDLL